MTDWRQEGEGVKWVPILNLTENHWKIPEYLLARMAYQESRFRLEIINGTEASPKRALGILQLLPEFWKTARLSIPFSDNSVRLQISEAAEFLFDLHRRFGRWDEALAAYNFGPGNEEKYLEHKIQGLPQETRNYVAQILADVPAARENPGERPS